MSTMNTARIFSIEGNIGTGKSTFLALLKEHFRDREDVCFLQEPVDIWLNCKDEEGSVLDHFYKDQRAYSFKFQMLAYISRLSILRKALENPKTKYIICERCLFTDKHVFCKMLYDDGMIDEIGYKIYNMWFEEFNQYAHCTPIYLRCEPKVSYERTLHRAREGETIPLAYLEKCHYYHEDWLKDAITVDANIEKVKTTQWVALFEQLVKNN